MIAERGLEQDEYQLLLCEYAAGTLDEARALIVAAHASLCADARASICRYEQIGGALLQSECPPAALSEGCLEKVLAQIDAAPDKDPAAGSEPIVIDGINVPASLKSYLEGCGPWKKRLPGMETKEIPTECANKAQLIRMTPGASSPAHGHGGQELTLVLDGAFDDEHGRYVRGDLIVLGEHEEHKPVADPQAGCLCLAVSCAPIKLKGWGAVLNPFLRT